MFIVFNYISYGNDKKYHLGGDFLLTGEWISFVWYFEPATALFDLNQSTTKLFNKKYPVWGIFIKTGCARCAVLELITTWI